METYRLAIAIGFALSMAAIFLLPIPYGVYASISVWIGFAVWLRFTYKPEKPEVIIKYSCINCDVIVKGKQCPQCGGQAFKPV